MQEAGFREENTDTQKRRDRVALMKKLLIAFLILGIALPILLCVLLFIKVGRLQEQVNALTVQRQEERTQQISAMENTGTEYLSTPQNLDGEAGTLSANTADVQIQPSAENAQEQKTKVYLTFDDGPSVNTEAILDILSQYDVKATFFVIGKPQQGYQAMYQRIVADGHTLGMHSYSHRYKEIYASKEAFASDLGQLQEFLYETTGVWSRFYRFPGGSSNAVSTVDMKEFAGFLTEENIYYLDWNVACGDATGKKLKPQEIADNVVEHVLEYQTAVVLLHDGADKTTTVEALPIIIERLQEMEQTELLPVTDDMKMVQHLKIDG